MQQNAPLTKNQKRRMKKKLRKQQQQQNAEEEEEEEEKEHGEDDTHVIPNTAPLTTRGVHQCYSSSPFLPLLLLLYMLLFSCLCLPAFQNTPFLSLLTHIPDHLILLYNKYDASVVGVTSIMSITGKAVLFWSNATQMLFIMSKVWQSDWFDHG